MFKLLSTSADKKHGLAVVTVFISFLLLGCTTVRPKDEPNFAFDILTQKEVPLSTQIQHSVIEANKLGMQPYLYFYADWCDRCQAINRNVNNPSVRKALMGRYIIAVDITPWSSDIKREGYKVDRIPTIFALNDKGQVSSKKLQSMPATEKEPERVAQILQQFFQEE
jgi:thiol:disulfide interchange protein